MKTGLRILFNFLVLLVLLPDETYAQNLISEYSNFECGHSKLIQVPFNEKAGVEKKEDHISINQSVFYTHTDQFSYWYKVVVKEEQIISFSVNPINSNDSYSLYVYKYKQDDFCDKVFNQKIKPLKTSYFQSKNTNEAYDLTDVKFKARVGEVYYFCVLNTSLGNCGHDMQMVYQKDTFNVKALHFPCGPEKGSLQLEAKQYNAPLEEDVTFLQAELQAKDKTQKTKRLNARIKITDQLFGSEVEEELPNNLTKILKVIEGRSYHLKCESIGYREFDHHLVISDYITVDEPAFDIYMDPLQTGDKFTMKHIYFYPNTYAFKKDAETSIDDLYQLLVDKPDLKVELQGHTNGSNKIGKNKAYKNRGPEWNFEGSSKKLSVKRAEAIKRYLIKKGIESNRLLTSGYGGERMIVENAKTMEAIRKNIRVEVIIL